MTGPTPPPKRFLHIVRFKASSFRWEYPLPSLRSSSNFLRLLSLLLATYISPFIFPSITCFRRLFLRNMGPIQLAFRFPVSCRIFLCSLTWSDTSSFLTWSVQQYRIKIAYKWKSRRASIRRMLSSILFGIYFCQIHCMKPRLSKYSNCTLPVLCMRDILVLSPYVHAERMMMLGNIWT